MLDPRFRDGSIVWATHQAIGKTAPNLFRQTTRHEVAVAAVSARYLCRGYSWSATGNRGCGVSTRRTGLPSDRTAGASWSRSS
ncbi:hypothetical protein [Leifsonia poae]|uniref:hypothetical protein n=1 Tax=Leifsonia poae TaxID=110933 RepID=UPI001CBB590B|nr:hypothetical protein [Leifsonia poae]